MEHQLLLCFPNGHCSFMEMRTQVVLQSFLSNIISNVQAFDFAHIGISTTTIPDSLLHTGACTHQAMYYKEFFTLKNAFLKNIFSFHEFTLKHNFLIKSFFVAVFAGGNAVC